MVALDALGGAPMKVTSIPGKGRGLVANRSLREGQTLEWSPVIAFPAEERPDLDQTALFPYYFVRQTDYRDKPERAEGLIVLGLMTLCNHADEPNAAVDWLEEPEGPAARLVALREINQGEEITLRYANIDAYQGAATFI
ncbi:MAG: SET domain-containing protein-lysine N-methyltransferase [Magnetovibrionaceae bacterium]